MKQKVSLPHRGLQADIAVNAVEVGRSVGRHAAAIVPEMALRTLRAMLQQVHMGEIISDVKGSVRVVF